MHKTIFYSLLLVIFTFCGFEKPKPKAFKGIRFDTFELEKSDEDLLLKGRCKPWNDGVVEKFIKVRMINMESDTFHIPAYFYCGSQSFCPFINYDVVEHYIKDSTIMSKILFTMPGPIMPLPPHDTLSLFLKVENKSYKHKYFVTAQWDSSGVRVPARFHFFD